MSTTAITALQVLLRAPSASGGTTKDWTATAYPDRLEIRFGRTGKKTQSRVRTADLCLNRSTEEELRERQRAQMREGYTLVCERMVDENGRIVKEEPARTWLWERRSTGAAINFALVEQLAQVAGVSCTRDKAHEITVGSVRIALGADTAGKLSDVSPELPIVLVLSDFSGVEVVVSTAVDGRDEAITGRVREWVRARPGLFTDPQAIAALEHGGVLPKPLPSRLDLTPSAWVFGGRARH